MFESSFVACLCSFANVNVVRYMFVKKAINNVFCGAWYHKMCMSIEFVEMVCYFEKSCQCCISMCFYE
jgi:hypothetical protein